VAVQFSTEISPSHVREATAGIFWRQTAAQPLGLLGLAALLTVAESALLALVPGLAWWWYAVFLGLMLLTALGGLHAACRYYQALALRNFSRFKGAAVRVSMDREAYRYEASWGSGAIEWARFQSLWCLKNVWVLLQHAENGASVLLPAADLGPEARNFLKDRMALERARIVV
jgi:hypothetical protein